MQFQHSLFYGLVLAILLVVVSCQNAILNPNSESIVVKGQIFSVSWRLINVTDYSNVSISLYNPHIDLASSGLDIVTNPFAVAKAGRELDSGFYIYVYDWTPSAILETSDSYQLRVDDGGVIMDSSEFLITSLADLNKTSTARPHGPSAAVVGGAVAGAVVGAIVVIIIILVFMAKRKGWSIKKEKGSKEGQAEEGDSGTGGGSEVDEVVREEEEGIVEEVTWRRLRDSVISDRSITPLGGMHHHVELEGSLGRNTNRNSELPGSIVGEEMPTED